MGPIGTLRRRTADVGPTPLDHWTRPRGQDHLAEATREQLEKLAELFGRSQSGFMTFAEFRRSAWLAFGGDCLMVNWAGMMVGIEKDGYAHH